MMNETEKLVRAYRQPWWTGVELIIKQHGPEGVFYAQPVTMVKVENDVAEPPPLFHLTPSQAQVLMDDLWNCGVRPTEGTGSAGQLAATQRHLEDMRELVFEFIAPHASPQFEIPNKPK